MPAACMSACGYTADQAEAFRITFPRSGSGMRPSSATLSKKSRDHLVFRNSMTPLFSPADVNSQRLQHWESHPHA